MRIIVYRRPTTKLSMRVTPTGRVHVTAPIGLPMSEIQKFVDEHHDWLNEAQDKVRERLQQRENFFDQLPLRTEKEINEALSRLEDIITPIVNRYASIMGVRPTCYYYRPLISRWGSCDTKTGVIIFSVYVLLLPDWCIEHVVVHEMCHLLVPNHGPKFHALMDKYFPRWREARKETLRIRRMEE